MFTMKEKVDSIVRNLKWEQARVRANVDGIYLNQGEIDRAVIILISLLRLTCINFIFNWNWQRTI